MFLIKRRGGFSYITAVYFIYCKRNFVLIHFSLYNRMERQRKELGENLYTQKKKICLNRFVLLFCLAGWGEGE